MFYLFVKIDQRTQIYDLNKTIRISTNRINWFQNKKNYKFEISLSKMQLFYFQEMKLNSLKIDFTFLFFGGRVFKKVSSELQEC